ncbi:superoxide dismutase family protein [Sphingomonas sp. SRS2]|uniref:superoxide dismutase family protein n=1 Tax=Sphingomonas sp. SRS2 TaxID=133190 RepID=UPI0006184DFE|nr:superoxide dismutase family protein [Sphingomonas sp. SRS2]KKC27882.1 superoxide dismutase [Sphingomonas sp. SRS2]
MFKISFAATSLLFVGCAFGAPALAHEHHHGGKAIADIVDGQGQTKGQAILTQHKDGIHVDVKAVGLPAGVHAVHIHTTGTCTGPDFTSAGGHWNPGKKQHGHDNPAGAHKGDMPNMTVGADGTGMLTTTVKGATLKGGSEPLFDADGAAIVVHAAADDYKTDPTGNAGGRLGCGIVKAE